MTNSDQLSIKLLNHASVRIDYRGVRFLCDPWYSGTCFEDGWGLMEETPTALEGAAKATHLWVSHFHSDHLHMPTLSELAVVNPNLEVLTNHSANFDTSGVIERAGFTKLTRLEERIPRPLSRDTCVIRYPCTGIDNMLLMRFGPWKILNYNDCNIPAYALRKLCRRFGHIVEGKKRFFASWNWGIDRASSSRIHSLYSSSRQRTTTTMDTEHGSGILWCRIWNLS